MLGLHVNPIISWAIGVVAAALWGGGIWWMFRSGGQERKKDMDMFAARETMVLAWSEPLTLGALSRFPRSAVPALVYAGHARTRKDYDEALHRFAEAVRRDPRDLRGYLFPSQMLRELDRLDEAEALINRARRKIRTDVRLYEELARIAEKRGDWPEAARRWAEVRKRFPDMPSGYRIGADALRKAGHVAEADALLAEAEARFPPPPPAAAEPADAS